MLPRLLWALALGSAALRADPGDVENSRDYAGFPRLPGFVITDFDEDNPAEFDFPVARPLPIDTDHVETVHVKGHRYAIRYELGPGNRPVTLFQTQQYYEKLASDGGFTVEKSGAVGNVTETFHRATAAHDIWVYLEPAVTVNVLTIVESVGGTAALPPLVATPVLLPAGSAAPPPAPAVPTAGTPVPASSSPETPGAAPGPDAPVPTPPVDPNDDSLYAALSADGRVVLPFTFQPGKDELDASSQPLVDRVVAMMKLHPDIFLRIEGHTDNAGEPDQNMRLSAQRALAVQAKIMLANIDKKRLDAVGVGGLQPRASNTTAAGREQNRRIELVLWKKYPAFHAPAPNGQNYYPNPAASSASAKPGF